MSSSSEVSGSSGVSPELLAALRHEIVESQKTQADFLKWKLIAIAAVASIAFGFTPRASEASDGNTRYLLCLVPLICAYVDLISLHIMSRIVIIGTFLRAKADTYEKFVLHARKEAGNPFVFEVGALHGSSFVFNFTLVFLGWLLSPDRASGSWTSSETRSYIIAGLLGAAFTVLSWILYAIRAKEVSRLAA